MIRLNPKAFAITALILGTFICLLLMPAMSQSLPPQPAMNQSTTVSNATTVIMRGNSFDPQNIVVPKGSTVTWVNGDYAIYKVAFDDFQSGSLNRGDTFSHTFNDAGTFGYREATTPGMNGTVTVR